MASDRFADLRKRLEQHGWQLIRISGSHHIFGGEGRPILSIPVRRGRVKAVYFRQVDQAVRAIQAQEDDEG